MVVKIDQENLEYWIRSLLALLLLINMLGSLFIVIINPEATFFGTKLGGEPAAIYLATVGIIGGIIAFLLMKNWHGNEVLAVIYFGILFIEALITNISFGFGYLISPMFALGLAVSIILLIVSRF